jgi:CitMHS family citrate-Mg2+:H+ or citrate-Ca2+:H+ symporter
MTLARPRLIWLNLALTLAMLGIAIARLVPLPLAFMIGFAVAMLLNYPSPRLQGERLKAHAENALPIVVLILAAGSFTGIMAGTGMIDAMAKGAMTAVPPAMGPQLGVVTAFLGIPLTFVLSNDAYYFGVIPIIAQTAQYGGAGGDRPRLVAQPADAWPGPLVAAVYLTAGLLRVRCRRDATLRPQVGAAAYPDPDRRSHADRRDPVTFPNKPLTMEA